MMFVDIEGGVKDGNEEIQNRKKGSIDVDCHYQCPCFLLLLLLRHPEKIKICELKE
jgi:hypothetical protein